MADFTETDTFPSSIYILDITDPALGGGPNTIMNLQARDLTMRTRWLYNRVNKIFFSYLTASLVVPTLTTGNVNGNTYAPNVFPLNFPDYTTPNDGVTRTWDVSISFRCAWTEVAATYIGLYLYTVTTAPAFLELARLFQKEGTLGAFTFRKIMTLAPNTRVALAYQNGNTGANATFTDVQLVMKEL